MGTEITLEQVTEGKIDGTGALDKFMATMTQQLMVHLRRDDINSTQFAEIYAASLNPMMQQAIAFVLTKPKAEAETDLIIKQHEKLDAEIAGILKQNELLDKQIEKMDYEIENIQLQNQMLLKQMEKLDQDILYVKEQILLSQAQREKILQEIENLKLQEQILVQQVEESKQKVLLMKAQVRLTEAQADKTEAEIPLIEQKIVNLAAELDVLKATIQKALQEVELMKQKVKTERAQTEDTTDGVTPVKGTIGKKNILLTHQATGFIRDAEQKAAKILTDLWSLNKSAEPANTFIAQIAGKVVGWKDGAPQTHTVNGEPQTVSAIKASVDTLIKGVDPTYKSTP